MDQSLRTPTLQGARSRRRAGSAKNALAVTYLRPETPVAPPPPTLLDHQAALLARDRSQWEAASRGPSNITEVAWKRATKTHRAGTGTLAKALRLGESTLGNIAGGQRPATPIVAFRIARLAGVGVDDVLAGRFPDPSVCPHCLQRREVTP